MILHGHVKGKIIEIDESTANLPEGTAVEIIPVNTADAEDPFCGAWIDSRPADEIAADIRKARSIARKKASL